MRSEKAKIGASMPEIRQRVLFVFEPLEELLVFG